MWDNGGGEVGEGRDLDEVCTFHKEYELIAITEHEMICSDATEKEVAKPTSNELEGDREEEKREMIGINDGT